MPFVKVAHKSEIPKGEGVKISVQEKSIALFNVDGTIYAVNNICTHAGAPLAEGSLKGTKVTCPLHYAQFDVTTGKAAGGVAQKDLEKFEVKVDGDEVHIDLP